MSASPLAQFPWSLLIGGAAGLALAVCVCLLGLRPRGISGVVALSASALAGAATGSFAALVWLWVFPMARPVGCLYSCAEVQFLSTEQFRQIILMGDLAWALPVAALVSVLVAAWAWRRAPRR